MQEPLPYHIPPVHITPQVPQPVQGTFLVEFNCPDWHGSNSPAQVGPHPSKTPQSLDVICQAPLG